VEQGKGILSQGGKEGGMVTGITLVSVFGNFILVFFIIYKVVAFYNDVSSEKLWVVSERGSHEGAKVVGYQTAEDEIYNHVKLWYKTMFSFTPETFEENVLAGSALCDSETANAIKMQFDESQLYRQLVMANAELISEVNGNSIGIARSGDGAYYELTVPVTQYIVRGMQKLQVDYVHRFKLYDRYRGKKRTKDNPFGLRISDWVIIEYEE
jgi:hypothetical protein